MPRSGKPTKRSLRELQCTAYHEAGHAVAAHVLKRGIKRVSIAPDDEEGSLGHCHHASPLSGFDPDVYGYDMGSKTWHWLERETLILVAGLVAEARFKGKHDWRGAQSDLSFAYRLADYLCSSTKETRKYISWMMERARNLFDSRNGLRWRQVRYVARELLSKKTISGKNVRELCQKATLDMLRESQARRKAKTTTEG
jgi:ATP-dependent Zn protease